MLLALPFPWQHLHSRTKTGSLRFLYHLTLYLARALGVKRQPSAKAPIKKWPGLDVVSGPHHPLVPLHSTTNACAPHLLYKLTLSLAEDQQEKRQPPDKAFRLVPSVTPSQTQNPTLNFKPLTIVQCSNLFRCLCKASCPPRGSTAPPSLVLSASFLMGNSAPASRSWIKI